MSLELIALFIEIGIILCCVWAGMLDRRRKQELQQRKCMVQAFHMLGLYDTLDIIEPSHTSRWWYLQ